MEVLPRLDDALRAEYGEYELRPGGEETIMGNEAATRLWLTSDRPLTTPVTAS